MNRNPLVLSMTGLLVAAAFAAPAVDATDVSASVISRFVSQYVFRGERLGGPSFQPSVEVGAGDLALSLWSSFPLADKVPGQSDPEFDVLAAYTFGMAESTLQIVPGFTLYYYPNAPTGDGYYRSTFEPSLTVNYTVAGIRFTPAIYYNFEYQGLTSELSVTSALPLRDLGTELDVTAMIGTRYARDFIHGASPKAKTWGNYWLLGIAVPCQLTKASKLTLGLAYTKGSDAYIKQGTLPKRVNPRAAGRGVVTISYAYIF